MPTARRSSPVKRADRLAAAAPRPRPAPHGRPRCGVEPLEQRTLFAILTVTTVQDLVAQDGLLSLREALDRANPGDTVNFQGSLFTNGPRTITLGGDPLVIDTSITVDGPTAPQLTVDGDGESGVFVVEPGVTATIRDLTVTGGETETGGGVLNQGNLTLRNARITGNAAFFGGGVASFTPDGNANLALFNTTVTGNFAAAGGGGVVNAAVFPDQTITATITNSTISGNDAGSGGGVLNYAPGNVVTTGFLAASGLAPAGITPSGDAPDPQGSAVMVVVSSTISGNDAEENGGGIANYADEGGSANLSVVDSTISGNTAGPDDDGEGGGIWNGAYYGSLANLGVTNSTVSGNRAGDVGGGLVNRAEGVDLDDNAAAANATVTNSTFSGNEAGFGGGLDNFAEDGATAKLTVTAGTIAFNTAESGEGGGISSGDDVDGVSEILLRGTIVARNAGTEIYNDFGSADITGTHNLIGDGTGGLSTDPADLNLLGTLSKGINPLLGALGNNGGPTQTHALLQGSPAINRSADFGLTTDQRGQPRPQSITADIGAYERAAGGAISGSVFVDADGNGVKNAGEGPAAGVTVGLDQDNDGVVELNEPQWTTGPDGTFIFRGLNAGTQRLRVVPDTGFVITQPLSGVRVINLAANQNLGGQTFGVQPTPAPTPTAAPVAPSTSSASSGYGLGRDNDEDDDDREDRWPFGG